VIVGCFLPWTHAAIFVVRLRGWEMMDGKIMFAIAVSALCLLLYQTIQKRQIVLMIYGVMGLAIAAITGLDIYLFYMNNYPTGPGVYLSFLGGAQIFVYSVFNKMKRV